MFTIGDYEIEKKDVMSVVRVATFIGGCVLSYMKGRNDLGEVLHNADLYYARIPGNQWKIGMIDPTKTKFIAGGIYTDETATEIAHDILGDIANNVICERTRF
jgi:coenzyme F420-reducing hydrogenase gamma subunit